MRVKWTPPESSCVFSRSCGIEPCPVSMDLPCEDYKAREPKRLPQPTTNDETREP